jgi:hypothetical protein
MWKDLNAVIPTNYGTYFRRLSIFKFTKQTNEMIKWLDNMALAITTSIPKTSIPDIHPNGFLHSCNNSSK